MVQYVSEVLMLVVELDIVEVLRAGWPAAMGLARPDPLLPPECLNRQQANQCDNLQRF